VEVGGVWDWQFWHCGEGAACVLISCSLLILSIQCQMTQGKCYTDFHCSRNAYLNTDIESRVSDKVFRANRQKGGRDCNVSDTSHISLTKVRVSFFKRGRKAEKGSMVRAECVDYGRKLVEGSFMALTAV
jgi:hypothetical protein